MWLEVGGWFELLIARWAEIGRAWRQGSYQWVEASEMLGIGGAFPMVFAGGVG